MLKYLFFVFEMVRGLGDGTGARGQCKTPMFRVVTHLDLPNTLLAPSVPRSFLNFLLK